jgi:hypothetical protein
MLCILAAPRTVCAQSEGAFAIGGEFTTRMAGDPHVRGELGPNLLWRFGHGEPGWGFHWGLNWFGTHVDLPIGGAETEIGELKIRPVMIGYGYSYKLGPATVTADVIAGYALGSIEVTPEAVDVYRDRLGARAVSVDVSNTFTLKPEVGVWYDVNPKIGINVNAGYVVARPRLTVHSTLGDDRRDIRADQFIVKVGMVYSIF